MRRRRMELEIKNYQAKMAVRVMITVNRMPQPLQIKGSLLMLRNCPLVEKTL
jgi:hypothetical protein